MCTTRPPRRRDGPDSMDKLFKQDFVIHTLDNYPQFLNSSVPYFVDSRLNNEGRRKVAMILDKLPYRDRLLPLLDGMRPEALMRESQTEYGQSLTHANSEGLRLSIDLEFEADPVRSDEFLRRRPKKGKQFSPGVSVVRTDWPLIFKVAPELEGSREEGLLLRNFVWRSTVADMYGVWDNFYPTALSFEPAPPMITEDLPFSAFTPEPSEVQLRIFWNPYAPHALPATLNGLSQSLAENLLGPEAKITVRSNPIYREIPVYVTSLTWVLYSLLSLGMASLPQRFGNQVMFDQYMKTKHSLIVMGCPFPVYWIGTFVMNWLILLLANTLVTGALAWFVPIFTDHSSSLIAVQLSMTSYSAAVLVYAYFWTFIFDSSRSYSLFMNLSTMMLSLGPAYLVSTFHDYKEQSIGGIPLPYISPIIHKVACFTLAPYVPVGTLMSVVMVINQANAERRTARLEEFFSFSNNVVWAMAGGLVQTVLYGLLIMFLDSRQYTAKVPNRATVQALKAWKEVRQNVRAQVLQQGGAEGLVPPQFQINKDSDVIHEEKRVDDIMTVFLAQDEARKTGQDVPRHFPNLNGDAPQVLPLIIVHRLHHLYLPTSSAGEPTVAVKGLSLGVSPGEVMGLLGPNGAGKSTTINLITSDSHLDAPSEGDGYLGGISVTQDPQTAFPYIGLVPQFDALWPEVTVDDNLYVFSKIKALDRVSLVMHSMRSFLSHVDRERSCDNKPSCQIGSRSAPAQTYHGIVWRQQASRFGSSCFPRRSQSGSYG